MDAEEARQVDAVLRELGIAGVVAPEDPENPAGKWRVYDRADPETRTDATADALASLAIVFHGKMRSPSPEPAPPKQQGPTRGFIIPTKRD